MNPAETPHREVAFAFANALVAGDFAQAHDMLAAPLGQAMSRDQLQERYEEMITYGEGPADYVEVMTDMLDWPAKIETDIGWAYVAICGAEFSEAVAVVVTKENDTLKIREIEWGRP